MMWGGVLSPICCDYRKIYSVKMPSHLLTQELSHRASLFVGSLRVMIVFFKSSYQLQIAERAKSKMHTRKKSERVSPLEFLFYAVFYKLTASFLIENNVKAIIALKALSLVNVFINKCFPLRYAIQFKSHIFKGAFLSSEGKDHAAFILGIVILPHTPGAWVKHRGAMIIKITAHIAANASVFIGVFLYPIKIIAVTALEHGVIKRTAPAGGIRASHGVYVALGLGGTSVIGQKLTDI